MARHQPVMVLRASTSTVVYASGSNRQGLGAKQMATVGMVDIKTPESPPIFICPHLYRAAPINVTKLLSDLREKPLSEHFS